MHLAKFVQILSNYVSKDDKNCHFKHEPAQKFAGYGMDFSLLQDPFGITVHNGVLRDYSRAYRPHAASFILHARRAPISVPTSCACPWSAR